MASAKDFSPLSEFPVFANALPVIPLVVSLATLGVKPERRFPSRWSDDTKSLIPSFIDADNLSDTQVSLCSLCLRIDEISRQLRGNDYVPRTPERSPSPAPAYGPDGKRTNTRENRYRKKLDDERHRLVSYAIKLDPSYQPPPDYKKPAKLKEKVFIPDKEHQGVNFIGLLLGPRGSTLKQMEIESGAKIAIRGKGSVKEGKGAPLTYQNQEDPLHCQITADCEEKIKIAKIAVLKIIQTASTVPEAHNELKRKQLRDLAALNGTLRDDECNFCQVCGATGHKRFNCPEKNNVTNNIICRICGSAGHMARDCISRNNPVILQEARERDTKLDSEYLSLMAELGAGDGPAGPNSANPHSITSPMGSGSGHMPFAPGVPAFADAPWARPSQPDMPPHARPAQFGFRPSNIMPPAMSPQMRFASSNHIAPQNHETLSSALGGVGDFTPSSNAPNSLPPWAQPQHTTTGPRPWINGPPGIPVMPAAPGYPGPLLQGQLQGMPPSSIPNPVGELHANGIIGKQNTGENAGLPIVPEGVPLPPRGTMNDEEYSSYLTYYLQYMQKYQNEMKTDQGGIGM